MAMGDGVGGTRFHAVTAKDTARIVDVVDAGVAFAGRNALDVSVFGGLDINAPRGTCGGAQEAADAFFQSVFVPVENVNATVASLKMDRFLGIVFRDRFPQHIAERHAKALD